MWWTKYLGIYYQKYCADQNKQVYFGCCDMNMKSFNNEYFLNKNNFWILVLKSIKSRPCMMIDPNQHVCLFEHGFNCCSVQLYTIYFYQERLGFIKGDWE